jgi:hypothetical protein
MESLHLGKDVIKPVFADVVEFKYPVELRKRGDRSITLPIVASGASISVKEQYAEIKLHYVFFNNVEKLQVNAELHKSPNTHSRNLEVYRVSDETTEKKVEGGSYDVSDQFLADKHTLNMEIEEEMNLGDHWKVTYVYYAPISCDVTGSQCSFSLPSEIYQIFHIEEEYLTLKSNNFFDKMIQVRSRYVSDWCVQVTEIKSSLELTDHKINSQVGSDVTIGCTGSSKLSASCYPVSSDFSFSWTRIIPSTTEAIVNTSYLGNDSTYYMHVLAFPFSATKEDCPSVEADFSDQKKYLFTLVPIMEYI